jgi:hypothetical protein
MQRSIGLDDWPFSIPRRWTIKSSWFPQSEACASKRKNAAKWGRYLAAFVAMSDVIYGGSPRERLTVLRLLSPGTSPTHFLSSESMFDVSQQKTPTNHCRSAPLGIGWCGGLGCTGEIIRTDAQYRLYRQPMGHKLADSRRGNHHSSRWHG